MFLFCRCSYSTTMDIIIASDKTAGTRSSVPAPLANFNAFAFLLSRHTSRCDTQGLASLCVRHPQMLGLDPPT